MLDFPGPSNDPSNQEKDFSEFFSSSTQSFLNNFANEKIVLPPSDLESSKPKSSVDREVLGQPHLEANASINILEWLNTQTRQELTRGQGRRGVDTISHVPDIKGMKPIKSNATSHSTIRHEKLEKLVYDIQGWTRQNDSGQSILLDISKLLSKNDPSKYQVFLLELVSFAELEQETVVAVNTENRNSSGLNVSSLPEQEVWPTFASIHKSRLDDLLDALANTTCWVIHHIRISDDSSHLRNMNPMSIFRQVSYTGLTVRF